MLINKEIIFLCRNKSLGDIVIILEILFASTSIVSNLIFREYELFKNLLDYLYFKY